MANADDIARAAKASGEIGKTLGKNIGKIDVPADVAKTLERIKDGVKHSHRNDGSIYKNIGRELPPKPSGYYKEYVHPTTGMKGPGAQRIVTGKSGEIYYSPNHYKSFTQTQ